MDVYIITNHINLQGKKEKYTYICYIHAVII